MSKDSSSTRSEPLVTARGLGKRYQLGGKEFWALRDVDLDLAPGEVLGVIGRNGAGKTTLLRILSRITEPTEGWARIRGRVGTLLETGTGFHPDLSGRENIELNGVLLGMRPDEMRARFAEIVEFSGVGRFLDEPLRHYSSGMQSRLAFATAAHLDTRVLLVDEVLAVGDVAFQEKCLRKMEEVTTDERRTVVFVSHSMGAVESLCTRAMLLENGSIHTQGATADVVEAYRALMLGGGGRSDLSRHEGRKGSGELRFTAFELQDGAGRPVPHLPSGAPARLVFEYESSLDRPPREVAVTVVVVGSRGVRLFGLSSTILRRDLTGLGASGRLVCALPRLPLLPGHYEIVVSCLVDRRLADKLERTCSLAVSPGDPYGTGRLQAPRFGEVVVDYDWTAEKDGA